MDSLQAIFILLFAAVLLVGAAQKIKVPYPLALILGGTALSFVPGTHVIYFDPNVILLIVLPPILYYAAFGIPFREFQKNWRDIFSLALGLVVVTTLTVGFVFKWMFPEFSWALAFAFGAIVSPPDATATTAILKHFAIKPRLVTLLEGESLVNDASAIVLYKLAVLALLTGSFSAAEGTLEFLYDVLGGLSVGLLTGFSLQLLSRYYFEPALAVIFSFTIPYVTYIIAAYFEVSGVLAVVTNGLVGARILLSHHSSLRRILGYAAWDLFVILLNCLVFILIGLQLSTITHTMTTEQIALYTLYALLLAGVMLTVRTIWSYTRASLSCLQVYYKTPPPRSYRKIYHEAALISWTGMRGIVSLSIAIALPITLANGEPLHGRNEVIFITFVIILITLLIPGLTLPLLIRYLHLQHNPKNEDEQKAREQLSQVVDSKLQDLLQTQVINRNEFQFLREYFISHHRVLELSHQQESFLHHTEIARLDVIHAQRQLLLALWQNQEIDDKLFNHLNNELDIEEIHIARAELK